MNTTRLLDKTLVFDDPNLRHGFTQIANVVLKDSELSHAAVRLYALLLSYAWQNSECFPGQERLAEDMGCKKLAICRTMKELVRRKLIEIERKGQGKPNIYHIRMLNDGYLPKMFIDKAHASA